MEKEKNKFNALTPEVLDENKQIYTEALDYAFGNSDIKNIAITGIYGAGKSTVWNTYVHQKGLSDIITVSLGTYENHIEDDDDKLKEASVMRHSNSDSDDTEDKHSNEYKKADNIEDDNRVERQLINQILSQIESKKIPFSKYGFKSNKSILSICLQSLAFLSVICSILLWITRDTLISLINESHKIFNGASLTILCAVLLFVPLFYYFCMFYRGNQLRISKITFKGAEANVNDDKSDESVLDRDIKELVYLLRSSATKVVVFEDLDRYNSTFIYTKLRELNFLLNWYVKINGAKEPVRFIYMLKDSLFFSKNRTKFFDFILPIVPIVDSKTSENRLIDLLEEVENAPDKNLLANISLYVDDMRLLKNIVNEYIVYSKIIPLGQIELESNKLFAIIILKNIFPNEFDLLQEDKGFVRAVFDKLESTREQVARNFNAEIVKINERIKFINNRLENDKFEAMALMISADVNLDSCQSTTWAEFLKNWSQNPDETFGINSPKGTQIFSYNDFINRFILVDDEKKVIISKMPEDRTSEINKLKINLKRIKRKIKDIEIYSYKEIISHMTAEQRDESFSISNFEITASHYFPLIKFLISDGLLDETYWYYKGSFDVDKSNILKRNDIIYMKGLLEGKTLDIFLDVETPHEIISRLKVSDFSRFNILNKKIFKTCLEREQTENVMAITDSVDINGNYKDLLKILDEFDLSIVRIYSNILVRNDVNRLVNILESCEDKNSETFRNILISILINKTISADTLDSFREYIEPNENIISFIPEGEYDIFIDNIRTSSIKFEELSEANCDRKRLVDIEQIQAYKLNVRNVLFITEAILEKGIQYGNLLNEIYGSNQLSSSTEYIEDNFLSFISEYINESQNEKIYTNNEEILLKILNSDISEEYKFEYLEKNETIISKLTDLKDNSITIKIINCLFRKNKVKFCSENIATYGNTVEEYSSDFIAYLESNLDEKNYENILSNNVSICNALINSSLVSDRIFAFVIFFTDTPIDNISSKLNQDRVNTLVKKGLVNVTEQNVETLLTNSHNEALAQLANNDDRDQEDSIISMLLNHTLSDDLIYTLINSEISDGNSLKLINLIEDSVLVERINPDKESIIGNIISRKLSKENIDYICKAFNTFVLKNEFIEALDARGELKNLDDKNLNDSLMKYVLTLSSIQVETKIALLITKIKNKPEKKILIEYISLVKEIADLSNVWKSKYPLLDNGYKEEVGKALIEAEYVQLRREKGCQRIMLVKKQKI